MADTIENGRHKVSIQELLPYNFTIHQDRFFEVLSQSQKNLLRDRTIRGAQISGGSSVFSTNVIIDLLFLYKLGMSIFRESFEVLSEIRRLFSFDSKQFVSLVQSDPELLISVNLYPEMQLTDNESDHIIDFIKKLFKVESLDETIKLFWDKVESFQLSPDFNEIGTTSEDLSFVCSRNYMENEFAMINQFSNSGFCEVSPDDMTTIFERALYYLLALRSLCPDGNPELQKMDTVCKALKRFIAMSPGMMSKLSDKHERKIRYYVSIILLSAEPGYAIERIPERHLGTGINTNYFSIEK